VVEEANAFSAGDNKACSNGKSRENKCSGSKEVRIGCRDSSQTGPLCNGGGLEKGQGKNNRRKEDRVRGRKDRGDLQSCKQFKRGRESRTPRLDSQNKYSVLATEINADTPKPEEKEERVRKVKRKMLREVTVKIGLERIDIQEEVIVEASLDSEATGLVISSEFARKQGFKLKKLERPMNVRNVDRSLNKERPIEHMVEVNIYYQGHRERTEINMIGEQRWTVILGMLWLARHNPEINWRTGEVKMTRYPKECGKQWRPVQGKLE